MKVRELLIRDANNGEYVKASGEDERSMKQGLFGWKGRIHVAFAITSHGSIRRRAFVRCPPGGKGGPSFARIHEDMALSALGGSGVDAPHRQSWNELAGRMERCRGCSGK